MCEFVTTALTTLLTGSGATAAGATAGAATAGSALLKAGTFLAAGSSIYGGIASYRANREMVRDIERQKETEAQLNSVREQRAVQQYKTALATQRAELAKRGLSLDSPTAVFLGQTAAREMAFEAQTIRQGGQATQQELTDSQRRLKTRGTVDLFRGGLSAAGRVLTAAPDLWPELLA